MFEHFVPAPLISILAELGPSAPFFGSWSYLKKREELKRSKLCKLKSKTEEMAISKEAKIGIIVGSIAGFILIVLILVWICYVRSLIYLQS